jgi:uncharacterized membrane protein YeiH
MTSTIWLTVTALVGTAFGAVSGALVAIENELDIIGMVTLGTITGLGGGIVRDFFLGDLPAATIKDYNYLITCVCSCVATFFFYRALKKLEIIIVIVDAISLGVFLVYGLEKAISLHMNTIAVMLMGIFTCSFGGVVRDIIINRVPYIFRREIYLLNAVCGAILFVFMQGYFEKWIVDTLVAVIVIFLRLYTYFKNWRLPIAKEYKF